MLGLGEPCCHLSAARLTFDSNQSGKTGEGEEIGWWVLGASQQALRRHPDLLPLIQHWDTISDNTPCTSFTPSIVTPAFRTHSLPLMPIFRADVHLLHLCPHWGTDDRFSWVSCAGGAAPTPPGCLGAPPPPGLHPAEDRTGREAPPAGPRWTSTGPLLRFVAKATASTRPVPTPTGRRGQAGGSVAAPAFSGTACCLYPPDPTPRGDGAGQGARWPL